MFGQDFYSRFNILSKRSDKLRHCDFWRSLACTEGVSQVEVPWFDGLMCPERETKVKGLNSEKSGKRGSQFEHESPCQRRVCRSATDIFCHVHLKDGRVVFLQLSRNEHILKGLSCFEAKGKEPLGRKASAIRLQGPLGPKVAIYSAAWRPERRMVLSPRNETQSPDLKSATFGLES